ncbi:MAG TPA: two-component system response regulator CreB [Nitrospiraceae bacterium]|nr:two-component system response regulator CreB [Nitrospiraceae bacterium]
MNKKILIIEDEPSIADNITYALSTEGFDPVCCGTGKDALSILNNTTFELIILDIGLPDVSGFELLKEIRKTANTPVICVTARSDEIDRVVGLEIGADDYIVKPFSPRELTARVRAVLRRTTERTSRPLEETCAPSFPFHIDKERYAISYYDEPLELSRYEFRLLCVLISNPGRVYSREQLMTQVWEEPDMSLERTVDTHIKTIRQKLKAIRPDEESIVTHRGLGYSLKEST